LIKSGIIPILILLIVGLMGISFAGNFEDKNQGDFSGTYANTSYNGNGVILNGTNITGTYTSRIFDSGSLSRLNNLSYGANVSSTEYYYVIDNSADFWKSNNSGYNWSATKVDYNGGDGNLADTLRKNSSNGLFIANAQDVWSSIDYGVSWTKVNDDYNGAETYPNAVLTVDRNNNLIIVDTNEQIWKSTDSGVSFTKINSSFSGGNANALGIAINNSNAYFIVDSSSTVWMSINAGVSWTKVNDDYNGAAANGANGMDSNSTNSLFIVDGQDIWASSNSGTSFAKVNDDFNGAGDVNNAKLLYVDLTNRVYIPDTSEDVYMSSDSGATFSLIASDMNGAGNDVMGLVSLPISTNLSFQVKNCSLSDCSDGTWQNANLNNINLTGRYFQYKSIFTSQDSSISLKLYNISLDYTLLDTFPPAFSNYSELPGNSSVYSSGQTYKFNVSISDDSGISSRWIEFNNVNYTNGNITNNGNVYSFNRTNLGAGTYSYRWWANDTLGYTNSSEWRYYTVTRAVNSLMLSSSAGWTFTRGTSTILSCTPGFGTGKLYKDDSEITNPSNVNLSAGGYSIKCNTTESQNYSSSSLPYTLTVNKINSTTILIFSPSSPQAYGIEINASCYGTNQEETAKLYRNGIDVNSNENGKKIILQVGNYDYVCNVSETQNYTSASNSSSFIVTAAETITSLITTPVSPIIYGTESNFSCSNSAGLNTILYINSEDKTSEKGINFTRAAGIYTVNCTSAGNQNYSGNSQQQLYSIGKADGQVSLLLNSQGNNLTIKNIDLGNISATALYGSLIIYKNGADITSENGLAITRAEGYYNITAVSSGDENHSSASITRWLNVTLDITPPEIILYSPQSGATYGYNESLNLKFSASDENLQRCWYNLGNENITLINCGNTTFNVSGTGSYTLTLYANDSYGNENSKSAGFSVNIGAPTITLNSPIDSYLNNSNVSFKYVPSDTDLASCELWGDFDGEFKMNQTSVFLVNDVENSFFLNLSDGTYKWNVKCNDGAGHSSFNGNKTFHVDTAVPNLTLSEPSGTKTSIDGIPLTFLVADNSPLTCKYNVEWSTGGTVISNTTLANCASTSFSVSTIGSYILNLFATDSAGNTNSKSSNFSVSTSAVQPPSPSAGGGGGGSSSGSTVKISKLDLSAVSDMIVNPGESRKISLVARNTGTSFLNNCKLIGRGENSGWISSEGTRNIGNGEIYEFTFILKIPVNLGAGRYNVGVGVECEEGGKDTSFSLEIIEKKLNVELNDIKREGKNKLRIVYSISEVSNQEQDVEVEIIGMDNSGKKIFEVKETRKMASGATEQYETTADIADFSGSNINILINAKSGIASAFVQQGVILGNPPLVGLAVLAGIGNTGAGVVIIVLVMGVFSFFIVRRIIKFRKMAGLHKVKDKGYTSIVLKKQKD